MSTSAAVYVESADKVVRVNSDGYPEYMVPALQYLSETDLVETFVSQDEYSVMADSAERFQRYAEHFSSYSTYVAVPQVGWAFADDPIRVTATVVDGKPHFSQQENHHYVLTRKGEVIEVTKEGAPVSS